MQTDATVPLAVAVLVFCGIGYAYGISLALKVLGYAFAGLLLLGMPLLMWYSRQGELEQFRVVQDQHGGRLHTGWIPFVSGPSMTFEYRDSTVRLTIIRRSGQNHRPNEMQITLEWPDPHLQMVIHPQGVLSHLGRMVGFEDIEVGRAIFDDAYVVKANDPDMVRSLLTKDVQHCVHALTEQKSLSVRIKRGRLTVRAQHHALSSNLATFTDAALRLHDGLEAASEPT